MTGPADPELRDRLARLAAAVPVNEPVSATPEAGHLVRGPVVWRRSAPSRLAVATVVVATLAVVVWGGMTGRFGPAGPGTSNVVNDGTFELTLAASKSRYSASDPIVAHATLRYLGSDPSVTIFHSEIGPVGFAIDEPVPLAGGGAVQLSAISRLMCTSSVLRPGIPLDVAFSKSGGNTAGSPPPSDDVVRAFFGDPVLRLPVGTWHLVALASLSLDSCGGEKHQLQARITIKIDEGGVALVSPSASHESRPGRSATPSPGTRPDLSKGMPDDCPLPQPVCRLRGVGRGSVRRRPGTHPADRDDEVDVSGRLALPIRRGRDGRQRSHRHQCGHVVRRGHRLLADRRCHSD